MGTISTGVGLISGINTGQLIESLLALEARPKTRLQQRIAQLDAQRTAFLDINARLLNLKTAAASFRKDEIFRSIFATSSDAEVLGVSATTDAEPGTFFFRVKQLVSTSQQITRGFADRDTTPLGLDHISFEFGQGQLSVDRDLNELNGGVGIDRGTIEITDSAGDSATIDLSEVTTVNEVLAQINAATDVAVEARVEGDHLVITDNAGGAGSLTIANGEGDTTATDLGIEGAGVGGLTGSSVYYLGGGTSLASLNDGTGVLIRDNVTDLVIHTRDPNLRFDIDLGRIDAPLDDDTKLTDLNNGEGVSIDDDNETPDIKFVARDGTEFEVDLTGVDTVGELRTRVGLETGGHITIGVDANGERLVVTDVGSAGATGELKVLGAGETGDAAAEDLGIYTEGVATDSYEGDIIPNVISQPRARTVQDVLDRINTALATDGTENSGLVVASIAADGRSIQITDNTGGTGTLRIEAGGGVDGGGAAADLGIWTEPIDPDGVAGPTHAGSAVFGGINSILMSSINGGSGLGEGSSLTLTDRNGDAVTVSGLDAYETLDELMAGVNDAITAAGNVELSLGFNSAGNGLQLTDSSGGLGNLIVSGDAAAALGLETDPAGIASDSVRGDNLQRRYIDRAMSLSELNYGRGISTGSFTIRDGFGEEATVTITSRATTLDDVIQNINSRGLAIRARVNDTGDGLVIEEDLGGSTDTAFMKIKITAGSGSTAGDLGILGEADSIGGPLEGAYEKTVDLNLSDTLNDVLHAIGEAGVPVDVTAINAGSGATPYRLSFTSQISGRAGEMIIDAGDFDLGLTTMVEGRDAKVFFGAANPEDAFIISSATNSLDDVIDGVTIDLLKTSDDIITVTTKRDTDAMKEAVNRFVTNFNDSIARIDQYDFYNIETEERGALLGNSVTARIRSALLRTVRQPVQGVTTQYQYLTDVGVNIASDGQLEFDEDVFNTAYAADPAAVENLFAAFEAQSTTTEEIAPGIEVSTTTQDFTSLGIGDTFDQLLEGLTNSIDGTLHLTDEGLGDQIKLLRNRMEEIDERLAQRRISLQREFTNMELALLRFQDQGNALASMSIISRQ